MKKTIISIPEATQDELEEFKRSWDKIDNSKTILRSRVLEQ